MNARRKLSNDYYTELIVSQHDIETENENQKALQEQLGEELWRTTNEKVERMRVRRFMTQMKLEQELDDALTKKEIEKKLQQENLETERKLGEELENKRSQALRDEKLRQQVRNNSHELRDLEFKLRSALTSKEVAAQVAEKQALKLEANIEDVEYSKYLEKEAKRLECIKIEKEMERQRKEAQHFCELTKQMHEQEKKKSKAHEYFLKEKARIDEVVKIVMEEQHREIERQHEKQQKSLQEIKDFQQATQAFKEKEKLRMEEEMRKMEAFNKMQEDRKTEQIQLKQSLELAKSKVQKQIGDIMAEKQRERDEWELIQQELHEEEEHEAILCREKAEAEQLIRQRIELKKEHDFQMHYKTLQDEIDRKEGEELRKQLMTKFEEDERLSQLNDQKRRMKMQEYRRDIDKIIEERKELRRLEREKEENEMKQISDREKAIQDIVDEERCRLISQHTSKLIGFLPKGLLRDEKDLELLPPEVRKEFAPTLTFKCERPPLIDNCL